MPQNKKDLRKEFLSLRKSFPTLSLTKEMLLPFDTFSRGKVIFCYLSFNCEVETRFLIENLLKEKIVVVPYCTDLCGNMICVKIDSLSDLKEGHFGIAEPKNPIEFPKEKIDFAVVPGIAFDKEGYRLGYGKGYYDRFLKDISPYKLGVCRKDFYVEHLPHDEYDVKMDSILAL